MSTDKKITELGVADPLDGSELVDVDLGVTPVSDASVALVEDPGTPGLWVPGSVVAGGIEGAGGADTIANGLSSKVVTHGVAGQPEAVVLTPRGSTPEALSVSDVGMTTFTAHRAGSTGDLGFYWQALGITPGAEYMSAVLADSPYAYWPMNEASGTSLANLGSGGDLTAQSAVTVGSRTEMPMGSPSPDFPGGTNGYANSASHTWWSAASAISMECWFYADAFVSGMAGNINSVVGDLASTTNGALIRAEGATSSLFPLRLHVATSGGLVSSTAVYNLSYGTLYHIVYTVEASGNIVLYVNGSSVQTSSVGAISMTFNTATRVASSEGGRWMDGTVGHFALYRSVLSASRVAAHYAAGTA
jgi:hypothetical protein